MDSAAPDTTTPRERYSQLPLPPIGPSLTRLSSSYSSSPSQQTSPVHLHSADQAQAVSAASPIFPAYKRSSPSARAAQPTPPSPAQDCPHRHPPSTTCAA